MKKLLPLLLCLALAPGLLAQTIYPNVQRTTVLTSGRVPFADAAGRLVDSAALTFAGGILSGSFTGALTGNVTGNVSGTAPAGLLTGSTLASNVLSSSLTALGTVGTGVWQATPVADAYVASSSAWNAKEPAVAAGTTGDYYRGDKTMQPLNKAVVGLPLVENTALSTWAGSTNVNTLGTVGTGTWNATPIADGKIAPALTGKSYNGVTTSGSGTLANSGTSALTGFTGSGASSGTNTGDQTISITGDGTATGSSGALTLTNTKLNGVSLAGLATGIMKNTTGTGAPSIAVAGDFPTLNQNTTGSAGTLAAGHTISTTGDATYTSAPFDGSGNVTGALTFATVNSNVGSFGSATQAGTLTVNAKGQVTTAGAVTITPAVGNVTGLGTGVATALGVNVGSAGAPVVNGGALGTPSSGVATNLTGTASGLTAGNVTTNANLAGPIASVGNTTSITAKTGTGTTFAMQDSPTFTGTVTVPTPSNGTDASTKAYVDAQLSSFDIKNPVVAATTAALSFSPTYSNGSSGVGATLTGSIGILTIDGYTPVLGDRLLIKNEVSTLRNGVYTLTTVGTGLAGYVLTRATDFNQATNIVYGDTVAVLQGTTNVNQQFTMNNQNAITVGTTAVTFAQTSGGSQLTAGNGITITGNSVANSAVLPIGTIAPAAIADGGTWLQMDGSVYTQSTYATLFARLGHTPQFTWNQVTGFGQNAPNGIAYGASLYVACFNNGKIYTSPDRVTWTSRTSGVATQLNTVAYGNGVFVIAGNTHVILTSPDGITWTNQSVNASSGNALNVVYQNSIFYCATSLGYVLYSSNGTSWSDSGQLNASWTGGSTQFYAIGKWWILPCVITSNTQGYAYSSDGTTWTYAARPTTNNVHYLGCDGSYVYAVDATTADIFRTANGSAWTNTVNSAYPNTNPGLQPCGMDISGRFIITAGGNTLTSTDGGATWGFLKTIGIMTATIGGPPTNALQYVNKLLGLGNKFFVVASTTPSASVDGAKWFAPAASVTTNLAYGFRANVSFNLIGQINYWNGYYFFFGPGGGNTTDGGIIYWASEPYDPATQFQIPTQINADATYKYIKAL